MVNPTKYYVVSIHNQIYTTVYYKICSRSWNYKTDKYTHLGCAEYGTRGKGNALGMGGPSAVKGCKEMNRALKWHHKRHSSARKQHNILI